MRREPASSCSNQLSEGAAGQPRIRQDQALDEVPRASDDERIAPEPAIEN